MTGQTVYLIFAAAFMIMLAIVAFEFYLKKKTKQACSWCHSDIEKESGITIDGELFCVSCARDLKEDQQMQFQEYIGHE